MLTKNERFYELKRLLETKVQDCDFSGTKLPQDIREFVNRYCIYELRDDNKSTYIFHTSMLDVRRQVMREIFHADGETLTYQYAVMYYSRELHLIYYQDLPHEDVVYIEAYREEEAFAYRLETLRRAQENGIADERVRNEPPLFPFGDLFY